METRTPGPAGPSVATPQHRALASTSRVAILRLVRAAPDGLTAGEVAATTGQHLSTTRAHLDRLVAARLLVRDRSPDGTPGRPAWRYRAAEPDPAPAPYRSLAAALLDHLAASPAPGATAARAGQGWGRRLAAASAGGDAARAVVRIFDGLGFAPVLVGEREVRLRACPFLDLVAEHADTMCGLHLGVARGVLAAIGMPDTAIELDPFGAPDACVLRLPTSSPS